MPARGTTPPSRPTRRRSALDDLDLALTRIRRFWQRPEVRAFFAGRVADLPTGMDAGAFRVLRVVEQADEPASIGLVATQLDVDASTASRLVDRAVTAGYVERRSCQSDRRRSELALTSSGESALADLRRVRLELLERLTRDWGRDEVETLASSMLRLYEAIAELELVPESA